MWEASQRFPLVRSHSSTNDIQEAIGKKTVERALNTSDLKEARKLKLAVLTEVFDSFERARGSRISSADIEHVAQRYLRERLEEIAKQPDETFTLLTDSLGNDLELTCELLSTKDALSPF